MSQLLYLSLEASFQLYSVLVIGGIMSLTVGHRTLTLVLMTLVWNYTCMKY